MNELEGVKFEETPVEERVRTYQQKVEQQEGNQWMQQTEQVYRAKTSDLNVLSVAQVAEYFRVSHTTAWFYMKEGIIPSFQQGRRWFTHDYVIDAIEKKARLLFDEGYARRSYPRMVSKYEHGVKW